MREHDGARLAGARLVDLVERCLRVHTDYRRRASRTVAGIFGPSPGSEQLCVSRLRVSESTIDGGQPIRQTRMRIDRHTHGTVPGALFEEQPHVGGSITVDFELRSPRPGEAGLLALLLRDLVDGHIPLGGSTAVGRGAVRGHAEMRLADGVTCRLGPDAPAADGQRLAREVARLTANGRRRAGGQPVSATGWRPARPTPDGCTLVALEPSECAQALDWTLGGGEPAELASCRWLLGHLEDGVVWGRRSAGGPWHRSDKVFPGVSPVLRRDALWELRLFGEDREALLWNHPDGSLTGRLLVDSEESTPATRPLDEQRVLLGDRVQGGPSDGFTVVADGAGSRQVVPLACDPDRMRTWPLRLAVRHYLAQDPLIGTVSVRASRLVGLSIGVN